MQNESRIKNSMRNTVFGIIGMMLNLLFSFIAKSVFINILGNEFNGVNYLFNGILNALNLAEMGFAGAIAYALYKPLSNNDTETAAALMNFFRQIYRLVAVVVAILGAICIPFLQYFIKDDISTLPFTINRLRSYYSLFLLNTVLSYLLAYKRTIITANQEAYIVTTIDYVCNVVLNILQIILLVLTKNYYAYLIIMLAKTVINNLVLAHIANKKYPYLTTNKKIKLISEEKKKLFTNVRAMMLHKIGSVVILNSSTIVVSALVGVMENSLYGNYLMLAAQVMTFINVVFNSVTASVGNLCAGETQERQIEIFNNMNYLSLWLFYFVFICYVCLFNPFMDIWLGSGNTFSMVVVFMLSINQSIGLLRKSVLTFRDAKGLFKVDRYKPIVEALVGIILAITFGNIWGVFGILLGYTISTLFIAMPIEKWALFKRGFNIPYKKYVLYDLLIMLITGLVTIVMYFIVNLLGNGIFFFILKLLLCLLIPNIIFFSVTYRTNEFKYFVNILKRLFQERKSQK